MPYRRLWILVLCSLAACRESDRPLGPENSGLAVDSDPRGGRIVLDGDETGMVTPDTLWGLTGVRHEVGVRLDTADLVYGLSAEVQLQAGRVTELRLPLLLRCLSSTCLSAATRYHAPNQIRFAANALGFLLLRDGMGGGVFWPSGTQNSYASVGTPLFAGVVAGSADTVALGPYDWEYLAGRPAPVVQNAGGVVTIRQSAWILPPQIPPVPTVRGISVEQEVIGRPDVDDVLLIRLSFRNITGDSAYAVMDPYAAVGGGTTYEAAYVGFALDGDVGNAEDDALSYAPELNLAFIYDADFSEPDFGSWADHPGLIGVRLLEVSPSVARVILNGWLGDWDWAGATVLEPTAAFPEPVGWYWLSGEQARLGAPDHADPRIGFAPDDRQDMRVSVSAGPLRLAPGDSVSLTLALVIAPPADGSFTSGTVLPPGDPLDPNQPVRRVAEPLLDRARAAEVLR